MDGLGPEDVLARLDAMAERYADAVDEVEAEVFELRRQVSLARRCLEATSSFEECVGGTAITDSNGGSQPSGGQDGRSCEAREGEQG